MGITKCQKHGPTQVVGTCNHAADAMKSGAQLPSLEAYQARDEDGGGLPLVFLYCGDCVRDRDLPLPARPLTLDEVEDFGDRLDSVPVCLKCLREAATKV
jgi:hypothetical protein